MRCNRTFPSELVMTERIATILYYSVIIVLAHLPFPAVAQNSPRFNDSFLNNAIPEDLISDLVGRQRLIVRHTVTEDLHVFWVTYDRETRLPYVVDPITKLPFLLQYSIQEDDPLLYRMFRGKDHKFVVTDDYCYKLYRPGFNNLGEVELSQITEQEAGFTLNEVKQL